MKSRNKCTQCKHKWKDNPGAQLADNKVCPKCSSAYWKWSSFEFDKKKHGDKYDFGGY
jgi:hypothetical protein